MVKIVTDSTVDLPHDIARELDITIVPLSIHFGDRTYLDRQDIDADKFYHMLRSEHVHPRTAQPPAGLFEEAYRRLASAGQEIVAITLSADLSGTYNSAVLAAQSVPEAGVTVVDSRSISMAMGSMVIRAARLAQDGRSRDEIAAAVQAMIPRLGMMVMADTLTYLQRGGRIGRAGSLLGAILNIKPIISLQDGQVVPVQRVRTRGKALQEMAAIAKTWAPFDDIYVMHTAAPEAAAEFAALIQPLCGDRKISALPLGPVVGVHLGPGAVGMTALRGKGADSKAT